MFTPGYLTAREQLEKAYGKSLTPHQARVFNVGTKYFDWIRDKPSGLSRKYDINTIDSLIYQMLRFRGYSNRR